MEKPPKSLFKFMSKWGPHVLRTRTIKFSRPSELNDPFEVRPHLRTLGEKADWSSVFDAQKENEIRDALTGLPPTARDLISPLAIHSAVYQQRGALMDWMGSAVKTLTPMIANEIYRHADAELGILCLTESFDNLLMWAHYADSHRGIVLEFSAQHPFFNRRRSLEDEFYHLRKVGYLPTRPSVDLYHTDASEYFLTKSKAWDYEIEWRILIPLKNCFPFPGIETFQPEMLTGVILGANVSPAYRDEVLRALTSTPVFKHVTVRQAKLNPVSYALDFETAA